MILEVRVRVIRSHRSLVVPHASPIQLNLRSTGSRGVFDAQRKQNFKYGVEVVVQSIEIRLCPSPLSGGGIAGRLLAPSPNVLPLKTILALHLQARSL